MHPYLTRLGVRPEVQQFFRPFLCSDAEGNLLFPYGDGMEHFGFAFHHIPVSENFWMAGNKTMAQVRQVIFTASALDAVAWLNKNYAYFSAPDNLLFLSAGAALRDTHLCWINKHLRGKSVCLVFGNDVLGRIADLKVAAGMRGLPLTVYAAPGGQVTVGFRSRTFSFSQAAFSLNAFERAAKFRFGVRTDKPKEYLTCFDELKAGALNSF